MNTWPMVELGKVAEIKSGGSAPQNSDDFGDVGTPFVRAGSLNRLTKGAAESSLEFLSENVAKKHRLHLFPAGSILFAKSGMSATKGLVYRLVSSAFVVNHLAVLITGPNIDSGYLRHCLQVFSPTRLIQDAAYPSIRLSDIATMKIPLPPLKEQQRIADILDRVEALRAKRRAALAQLDELTQSIFFEMFGDPATNLKGWSKKPFGEVCVSRLGKMLDKKQQTGKHLRPYLRNANTQWFHFDLTDVFKMDFNEADRKEFRLEYGDLLICEGGEPGRAAIWRGELEECYYQKALHCARPHRDLANSEYLAWLLLWRHYGVGNVEFGKPIFD